MSYQGTESRPEHGTDAPHPNTIDLLVWCVYVCDGRPAGCQDR